MINSVVLMGRLTHEPELKATQSGLSVVSFTIACDKAGAEGADFIRCVAWRKTAEIVSKYFHKGSMIAVQGSIQTNNYTDKEGHRREMVQVLVNNVSFCGSKAETAADTAPAAPVGNGEQRGKVYSSADNSDFEEIVDDDDDFPF